MELFGYFDWRSKKNHAIAADFCIANYKEK